MNIEYFIIYHLVVPQKNMPTLSQSMSLVKINVLASNRFLHAFIEKSTKESTET